MMYRFNIARTSNRSNLTRQISHLERMLKRYNGKTVEGLVCNDKCPDIEKLCVSDMVTDGEDVDSDNATAGLVQTSVFMKNLQGSLIEIDVTPRMGRFLSTIFVYFNHIKEIDISGCRFIDPDLFVDCSKFVNNLQKLEMMNCQQFQEFHFLTMGIHFQSLAYLDVASCSEISFNGAFGIINEMTGLLFFNFEPKNAKEDVLFWEKLLCTMRHIHFGHNVSACMPFYANFWRIPDSSRNDD